ncbi:C40 family peptidase [Capnocytophaga sp. ARDL2]|uniref:C40 family peptidase n=1 Tax=Capnocytophaga sp. ARDL2 TaxID=3238809 RepID=UPI0035565239
MKSIKLFLCVAAFGLSSQATLAQTKNKAVASHQTTQETIDKINRMMGVEEENAKDTKKTQERRVVAVSPEQLDELRKGTQTSNKNTVPVKNNNNQITCYLTEQLLNVANDYKGTRYSWGGMSRKGMDCSGFVKTAFDQFNINLPRTSREMASLGTRVTKRDAKPGDLIFFKNGKSKVINHVGIVIEVKGDEVIFIHSASSKGVSINSTNEAYYSKGFTQINRVYDAQVL